MALARWAPLREMAQFQNEMSRLLSGLPASSQEEQLTSAWAPQVDIYEDTDGIRLHADVPGVEQKDLDVKVENRMLTLRGERKMAQEVKKENYHRIERNYGVFSRSFMLPDYADSERVEASFKNGVLEVKIPKKEETRPKQIKVEVK